MSRTLFKLSTVASLVLSANMAISATPIQLGASSMAFLQQQFVVAKIGASSSNSAVHKLQVMSSHKDTRAVVHTRMQQMYQNLPVIGGYAIIHGKDGQHLVSPHAKATGMIYKDLAADLGSRPSDNSQQALTSLMATYAASQISEKQVEPVIYIDQHDKAHWAYKVSFLVNQPKKIPQRPTAYVDAKNMQPLLVWDDIKTERHPVYGVGFGGNQRAGKYRYDGTSDGLPLLELSRDDATQLCYMETDLVKIVDMDNDYYSNNYPMHFACPQPYLENTYLTGYAADGYDEINGAYSPSNDAMYIGYVIHHMYRDWYGVHALKNRDGSAMQLVMRVHYGSEYQNAFWDGRQMTYGDGGSMMYPLVSMGVGAHEISHGFTEQNSNLQYYGQSGGMNEAFSDMAAQAAIFYSYEEKQAPSFLIGDRIMKDEERYPALRYMDQPSKDGRSIDSALEYYDGIDVHHSSGVFNRFFYLIATTEGWNTRKAFDVMVKANQDYWTPYEKFQTGACGVVQATLDYGYPLADVQAAMSKIGLAPHECDSAYIG